MPRYPAIDLAGAVVVITGGGRGIGKATAASFAAAGATVVIGDRDAEIAAAAAEELNADRRPAVVTSAHLRPRRLPTPPDRSGRER